MIKILLLLSISIIANTQNIVIKSDTNKTKVLDQILSTLKKEKELKIKEKNIHPLKREFGFFDNSSDESKAIHYIIKDDRNSIKTILQTSSIDPLKEVNVSFGLENISGKYSLLSSAIKLKRLDTLKLIIDSLDDNSLKNGYLKKMMYESVDKDLSIYKYLLSKGIAPTYQTSYNTTTLSSLSLYATLDDIKEAISKGAKIDTNNTHYLQNSLQRDSFEIARYFIENYDFDLGAIPHDNSYFQSYLLYLTKLDSTKYENLEFFKYFLKKTPKETLKKYGDEFLKRVQDINPLFYKKVTLGDGVKPE